MAFRLSFFSQIPTSALEIKHTLNISAPQNVCNLFKLKENMQYTSRKQYKQYKMGIGRVRKIATKNIVLNPFMHSFKLSHSINILSIEGVIEKGVFPNCPSKGKQCWSC